LYRVLLRAKPGPERSGGTRPPFRTLFEVIPAANVHPLCNAARCPTACEARPGAQRRAHMPPPPPRLLDRPTQKMNHAFALVVVAGMLLLAGCAGQESGSRSETTDQNPKPSILQSRINAFVESSGGVFVDSILGRRAFTIEAESVLLRRDSVPVVVVGSIRDIRRRNGRYEIVIVTRSLLVYAESDSTVAYSIVAMLPRQRARVAAAVQFRSLRPLWEIRTEEATVDEDYEGEPLYRIEEHFEHVGEGRLLMLESMIDDRALPQR
jgi:hypothetical protein